MANSESAIPRNTMLGDIATIIFFAMCWPLFVLFVVFYVAVGSGFHAAVSFLLASIATIFIAGAAASIIGYVKRLEREIREHDATGGDR